MTKKELRCQMKRCNLSLGERERAEASAKIFDRVEHLPAFAAARCVAVYCALADEPATIERLESWLKGRRVVVPRVEGELLQFYDYDPARLGSGAFGIAEPTTAMKPCDASQIDLMIIPGTAFTAVGDRMGRGRGFYDRYLSQAGMRALKVGVCYAHQIVAQLPVEPHDVAMDVVITQ